jgi:threonylcarbamoyladenosine tRNA methylthiotransferase MtaB
MDRKGPLKIAMAALGCKTNQSDAACLASELVSRGHEIVPYRQAADVYVIHTCTVTQKTDYQSRQLIRRCIAGNPGAQVIVTGCYAQVSPEPLLSIPGVDFVVGVGERGQIPGLLGSKIKRTEDRLLSSSVEAERCFEDTRLPLFAERTRAYLKVQDGCNSFCSYCIVPYARGRNRSLPLERALFKARDLASQGFKQIILTGIHLGTYGEDLDPAHSLLHLLQALEGENLDLRVRLSSVEPTEFTPAFIDFLARSKKVCPHLHIPLQSGDDGILQRMNRNYSGALFETLVNRLVQAIPGLAIGLDVIAGFPGEDGGAFENTMKRITKLPIAYLHVFPFSARKGTPAASFAGQVPSAVIKARCQALRELGEEKRKLFYQTFRGQNLKVLVESKKDRQSGMLRGYSENYIPVLLQGGDEHINQEVEVRVTEVSGENVIGEILSPQRTQRGSAAAKEL